MEWPGFGPAIRHAKGLSIEVTGMADSMPMLRMSNIVKAFPGVRAVDGVSLELGRGEILALLGHNGAGKSTLVKIISGANQRDAGEMHLDGKLVDFATPRMAIDAGVHMVYQELDLIPHLTCAENIYLGQGRFHNRVGLIDYKSRLNAARDLIGGLNVAVDMSRPVGQLAVSKQQIVAIAKAISSNAKVVVFDEPTSALNQNEAEKLFEIMRLLAARGVSLILITHRLDEIFVIADRVMVMKDGKQVLTKGIDKVTKEEILQNMTTPTVGQPGQTTPRAESVMGDPTLICEAISDGAMFHDISFAVRRGEIVGLTGLIGSGALEVARSIYGAGRLTTGRVLVDGRPVKRGDTRDAVRKGLAFVSDDRKRDGLVLSSSVKHNVSLTILGLISPLGFVDRKKEGSLVADMITRLKIRVTTPRQRVMTLSGGNQQKVVLAKWLLRDSKVLILCEPTRGIDASTQGEIHKMILSFAAKGLAVVVISSEIDEILATCDRVIVLYEGRAVGEVQRAEFKKETVMALMYGSA